jgi:short-subunit dehydrogenase
VLINNAGVAHGQLSILDITPKQVQQLYNVNIVSHFNTVREFLPAMVAAKKGHVVTISSMAAFVCSPGLVAYSSSKSAALVFHEGLQQELRTFHNAPEVKCSVVHPTFADTPMVAKFKDSLAKTTAKLITPESVADAVVKQVLSGRGSQIVLNGNLPYFLTTLRAWPHYLSGLILMGANRAMKVCLQPLPTIAYLSYIQD